MIINENEIVAVGEIGIDLYWDKTNLEIQIESSKKNIERFEMLVEKLILLRSKLRNEKNYELSDEVRDILESSGLQIEDSDQGIQWKVTE